LPFDLTYPYLSLTIDESTVHSQFKSMPNNLTRWTLIACLAMAIQLPAAGQKSPGSAIASYLDALAKTKQFSGVLLVSHKGRNIYERAVGYASAELLVANSLETRFGIASVTKPMTRVIALKLSEEARLQLQDTIGKWVPGFPAGDRITLEMLLDHRSGLPHRATRPEEETMAYQAADMLEKAKHVTLEFEPGTKESYSSLVISPISLTSAASV